MFQEAKDSSYEGNYSFAIDKLSAIKIVDESESMSNRVDAEIKRLYNEIDQKRKQAEEATRLATIAQQNEKKQRNKVENLLGDKYLANARIALSRNDYELAGMYIDSSLQKKESGEASLLFSKIINSHPPVVVDQLYQANQIAINPVQNDIVAVLGYKGERSGSRTLRIVNYKTSVCYSADEDFVAMAFTPDGKWLYAAIIKSEKVSGKYLDAKYDWKVYIIKFSPELLPKDTLIIEPIPVKNNRAFSGKRDTLVYDVREYQKIVFTKDGDYMVLAGYASPSYDRVIGNSTPHHLKTIIEVKSKNIWHEVDESELSSFHSYKGIVELIDDRHVITDGVTEVYEYDILKRARWTLGKHTSGVNSIAVNKAQNKIAVVGEDNKLTILFREGNVWNDSLFYLPGDAFGEFVRFVTDDEIAVARTDYSINILSLKPLSYFDSTKLESYGNTLWEAQKVITFTGHLGHINDLMVSPDGKWLGSASDDNTARLWSLFEHNNIILAGSTRGIRSLIFSNDSKEVLTTSFDGKTRLYTTQDDRVFSVTNRSRFFTKEYFLSDKQLDEGGNMDRPFLRGHLGFISNLSWDKNKTTLVVKDFERKTSRWLWNKHLTPVEGTNEDKVRSKTNIDTILSIDSRRNCWFEIRQDQIITHCQTKITPEKIALGRLSPDGKHFIYFDNEKGEIIWWKLATPNKAAARFKSLQSLYEEDEDETPFTFQNAKFSKNGQIMVFPWLHSSQSAFGIINFVAGKISLFNKDIAEVENNFDINADGSAMVVAGRTGEVYLHDIVRNRTTILGQHPRYVSVVLFSPDGNWVASGSRDRTVRLWSINSVDYNLFTYLNPVQALTFSPDGQQLFVAAGTGIHSVYIPNAGRFKKDIFYKNYYINRYLNNSTNQCAQPDPIHADPLAFIPARMGNSRKTNMEKLLSKSIIHSEANKKQLARVLSFPNSNINDKIRALLELSTYGSNALNIIPLICSSLKTNVDYESPIIGLIAAELLPYVGYGAIDGFAKAYSSMNDKWEKAGVLFTLSYAYPGVKRTEKIFIAALHDKDVDIRVLAALSISNMSKPAEALNTLTGAIKTGHDLRLEASQALKEYGGAAIPGLINGLRSNEFRHHDKPKELAERVILSNGSAALTLLIDSLKANLNDFEFASSLIQILAKVNGGEQAMQLVLNILKTKKEIRDGGSLISSALYYFRSMQRRAISAAPDIIDIILQGSTRNELEASWALADMGEAVIPLLIEAIKKAPFSKREYLYVALGKFGKKASEAIPLLVSDLEKCMTYDCDKILEALGNIGDSTVIPILLSRLKSLHGFAKKDAIEAIGNIAAMPEFVIPELLLVMSEVQKSNGQKTECDEHYIFRECCETIRKFERTAKKYLRDLNAMRNNATSCRDQYFQLTHTINEIENFSIKE